eukprot:COSAG01_NODE_2676_length_7264_cov_6.952128_6_plen_457_part_00
MTKQKPLLPELKLYNTLKRQKELFKPLKDKQVSMYVCGVTVYDVCHIGHARAYVAFDCVRRILTLFGYDVTYVQNFTDIDDKIIQRCESLKEDLATLTGRYIQAFHADMQALNIKPASHYPKATEHIADIISMIQQLMDKGAAYQAGPDICFDISQAKNYGSLSKKVLDELEAGSRVSIDTHKKQPLDFVLWKASKPGEPVWDSPWGVGRPGWHIECSAMAKSILGKQIDIHAGGEDLIFPHHENEIAQSETANGCCFAKYWLHNGFVNLNNAKMSKSTQNYIALQDCLDRFGGEVLRFYLMKTHYRHPLSFSEQGLEEAKQAYLRLQATAFSDDLVDDASSDSQARFDTLVSRFYKALADDFNVAEAIGVLFDLNKACNQSKSGKAILKTCAEAIGLLVKAPDKTQILAGAQALIDERQAAKKAKDFAKADAIRDQLKTEFGLSIKDTRDGVRIV